MENEMNKIIIKIIFIYNIYFLLLLMNRVLSRVFCKSSLRITFSSVRTVQRRYYCDNEIEPKKSKNRAIEILTKRANEGDIESQVFLGDYYSNENIIHEKAAEYYRLASINKHPVALHKLAVCYLQGHGVELDTDKAIQLLELGMLLRYPPAFIEIGICYQKGIGVQQDLTKAFQCFEEASKQNHPEGFRQLALCYIHGYSVPIDNHKASLYLHKASDLGDKESQYLLGLWYYNGKGVEKDIPQAINYFTKAAEQHHEKAKEVLELCKNIVL